MTGTDPLTAYLTASTSYSLLMASVAAFLGVSVWVRLVRLKRRIRAYIYRTAPNPGGAQAEGGANAQALGPDPSATGGLSEAELRARIRELEAQLAKLESARGGATGSAGGTEGTPGG